MAGGVRAIVWLHSLRLWRYKWSFLNMVVAETLWIFVFLLGVLLFVPPEQVNSACRMAFWTVVAWSVISQCAGLMGGWTNFFISIGMVEEHLLRGVSPFKVILGRTIPSSAVIAGTALFMAAVINGSFGVDVLLLEDPYLLVTGMALMLVEALSYGLALSAISMRTGIPHSLLDMANFMLVGLLLLPVTALPPALRVPFMAIPYVAPMHLVRLGIRRGQEPLAEALALSVALALVMVAAALRLVRNAEEWIRKSGVRAVGFT